MPEFKRTWAHWPDQKQPEDLRDRPDKTAKRAFVSFVRSMAQHPQPDSGDRCLVAGCDFYGYVVELGPGLTTRLCSPHRRDLFRRAREASDRNDEARGLLMDRPCRFCGEIIPPEDDPCRRCLIGRSPLVRLALELGAKPLCACGKELEIPGTTCPECQGDSPLDRQP